MPRPEGPLRLSIPLALILIGGAVHVFFAQAGRATSIHAFGTDDAYISFRYAENLVAGEGLTYNPGERVEGYSNLLHVLVAAALLLVVDRSRIYVAVSLMNLALLAAGLLVFHRLARRKPGVELAFTAAVLLALAPPLWAWSASGMETIGVLVLQLWLWLLFELWDEEARPPMGPLAAVLGLLVFVRADGFVSIAIGAAYWLARREGKRALLTAAVASPFLLLSFGARFLYYGRFLPNTYYAKVGGPLDERLANALAHLSDLAVERGLLLHLLAVAFVLAWELAAGRSRRLPFGPFFAAALIAYWLYIGGDHFGDRFLLLVFPVGIVILLDLFRDAPRRAARVFLVIVVLFVQLRPLVENPRFQYGLERYDGWITLGRQLGERYDDRLLAVDAAGKIPFFSGLDAVDMRGLIDPHIGAVAVDRFRHPGHNKMDPGYVLERRPDLIATWIWPDLDAGAGLSRQRYTAAGYRVVLLANATTRSREANVLDVRGWPVHELRRHIRDGYRLGVLERRARDRGR